MAIPRTLLRRSLRISLLEGVLAEVVGACATGGVLAAWALYLGLAPLLLGLVGALPFAAQLLQLPAAVLARRAGSRRMALAAVAVSRQIVLPLAVLPFLGWSRPVNEAVLFCCASVSAVLGVVANTAWSAWMDDLVPRPLRGRYFARRNLLCAVSSVAGSVGAGVALDAGTSAGVLVSLALIASVSGLATTALLSLQRDPARDRAGEAPTMQEALSPLRDGVARRALAFQAAWGASIGLALAFYPLHLAGTAETSFARMAAFGSGVAAVRAFAAPLWNRALERVGPRPVLAACAVSLCLSPALWIFAGDGAAWILAVDAGICGVLMAAYSLAASTLPMAAGEARERAFFLAAFASAGGLATGLASTLGGALAHLLSARAGLSVATRWLFALGALGRIAAALLGLRIVRPAEDRGGLQQVDGQREGGGVSEEQRDLAALPFPGRRRGAEPGHRQKLAERDRGTEQQRRKAQPLLDGGQGGSVDPAERPSRPRAAEQAHPHRVHVVGRPVAEHPPLQRVEAAQRERGEDRRADHPRSRHATSASAAAPAASLPALSRARSSLLADRDRASKSPWAPRSPGKGAIRLSGRVSGSTGRSSICESQPLRAR